MLNAFEEQIKEADKQQAEKTLMDCLADAILTEDALKNLEIKPIKKYLGPICEGTLGEIYGPRGIGKTFLRDAFATCLTRGIDLGPLKSETPAGVLVFDGEMALHLIKARRAISKNAPEALRPLDLISNEQLYRIGSSVINLADPAWRDAILELIKTSETKWDVIIFDNLSSFLPGVKENDQDAWAPVNGFLLQLRWMGKAVIFIHHAGKSGDQRGTSSREDQLDFVLKLTLPTDYDPEAGCRFDAAFTKSRSLVGTEAAPFTFGISALPDGSLTWDIIIQKVSRKKNIIALLGNGVSQKAISEMLGINKSYVSRIRTNAIKQKLLNETGTEFTAQGLFKYGDIDIEKISG